MLLAALSLALAVAWRPPCAAFVLALWGHASMVLTRTGQGVHWATRPFMPQVSGAKIASKKARRIAPKLFGSHGRRPWF